MKYMKENTIHTLCRQEPPKASAYNNNNKKGTNINIEVRIA